LATFGNWALEFSSGIPVYRQIINLLTYEIGRGGLREGDRLPTIKELAEQFEINPNTVAKAYRELDLKGVIASRRGDGSFVSAVEPGKPLTQKRRAAKLDELVGRLVAEAKAYGISEGELTKRVLERMQEDE
jgi:GntR family transcriptional regulator